MKIVITISAFVCAGLLCNAQSTKKVAVPEIVQQAFKKLYPAAKDVEWEKDGDNYEAEYEMAKEEISVVFDSKGTLLETEKEIEVKSLPQAATNYVQSNLPGKKIKEASKITMANGTVFFEAEVDGKDYIFDEQGNFVRIDSEGEKDSDDEDHEKDKKKK
jgi:Putative beta-lactamase-inhibitor-like, PepSY-like